MSGKVRSRLLVGLCALLVLAWPLLAEAKRTSLKPGMNFFSPEQDIQLGGEAAAEAEKQLPLLNDARVDAYLNRLGKRLAAQAPGYDYPYQFKAVNAEAINAFALPGGFLYINRGTIEAAENEAQLAAVVAHEISHVALRHGTNQASKALLVRAPLMVLGGVFSGGATGGLTETLIGLGVQVGFTSLFLKYSRTAENQADLMGTQILFDAGYEPQAMARFFEKLEQESKGGRSIEFFSSHPSPKNRVKNVEREIEKLGSKRNLRRDSEDFQAMRSYLQGLPPPPKSGQPSGRPEGPSGRFRDYRAQDFALVYPDNWRLYEEGVGVVIAPDGGVIAASGGANAIAYGVIANVLEPEDPHASLQEATEGLLHSIRQANPDLREISRQPVRVNRQRGLSLYLRGPSPLGGDELDWLVTVKRPQGLFYLVFIAPEKEFRNYRSSFERMLQSLHFR